MIDSVNALASLNPTGEANATGSVSALGSAAAAGKNDGESFLAALGDVVANANADLQRAEAMSLKGIKGEAETHEVVTAIMSAEQSLRMAVAVRDKVVQAYLELSRMQI